MASTVAQCTEVIKDTAKELVTLCEKPDYTDLMWYSIVGSHLKRLKEIYDGTFNLEDRDSHR